MFSRENNLCNLKKKKWYCLLAVIGQYHCEVSALFWNMNVRFFGQKISIAVQGILTMVDSVGVTFHISGVLFRGRKGSVGLFPDTQDRTVPQNFS